MFASAKVASGSHHAACSGCSLCLLVCPVWRSTHDPRMTPEGRAKALQHGASPADIAGSIQACTLCGACEPVCPEQIDLVGMTLELRTRLQALERRGDDHGTPKARAAPAMASVLIATAALRGRPHILASAARLAKATPCEDPGEDILGALESGLPVPESRLQAFLAGLRGARTLVVEDGLWIRPLRQWLPNARVMGLGMALSGLEPVRRQVRKGDLYVIEPRAYHRDYEKLVKHYDRLRRERSCAMNLDLQRIAIPAAGQADWIVKGLKAERVVVERMGDAAWFERLGLSVVHVAELADH